MPCAKLVADAVRELSGLNILVSNAARQHAQASILDISTEQFNDTFKTNVYAMFWIIKAALPHMKPGSAIITTSSVNAYNPDKTIIDYAATKGAIMIFTKGLAKQLAQKGIRVNSVAPGPIWTPLQPSGGQLPDKLPEFGADTRWVVPASPRNSPPYTFCWQPTKTAIRPGRSMAPSVATEGGDRRRAIGDCYTRTRTYSPGASPSGASLPAPGSRAGTFAGAWATIHSIQSTHQEPGVSFAEASQSSNAPRGGPSVQNWYFGLSAGLTTPAIWPEPASTYRTGPPKNCEPVNTDFAGAMWPSRAANS